MKICIKCGKSFQREHPVQKRCNSCRTLICQYCEKEFISKNARLDQKYCCYRCKAYSQKGEEPPHLAKNRGIKPRTYHLKKRDKHGGVLDKEWRDAVFKRDKWTCQRCGKIGCRLQAHHIMPYKKYPELRYDVDNGQTLCISCHKLTDSYGWQNYHNNHKK